MIFLRKFLSAAAFAAAMALIISSCSFKDSSDNKEAHTPATSQPFTEREVEDADGTYVFDNAHLLAPDDDIACNDYACWLYRKKLINTAVITVNDLEGKTPYDYALDEYNRLYEGKGSGIVVLVNNATNNDIVFRTGACLTSIPQKAQDNAVYWATKEFIGGNYRRGVMRLLQLAELCPENIIDNAEVFESEQLTKLQKGLSTCDKSVMLIASHNNSETSNEDILKSYYARRYYNENGIMLMLETNSKKIIAFSDDEFTEKFKTALDKANELAAKEDYFGAVNEVIESLGGKVPSEKKK